MQSLVEDVNSAIVTYRQVAVRAREMDEPGKAKFAFDNLRRLLLDEYALEYSEYVSVDDLRSEFSVIECKKCDTTIKVGSNIMYDTAESGYRLVPVSARTHIRKYVLCGKCEGRVYFEDSDVFIQRENSAVSMIPYPPSLTNIMSEIYNSSKFWKWFDMVWGIAEEKHFQQRQHVSRTEDEGI